MFGPDTQLMFDAMQMVAITAGVVGAGVYFVMRRRKKSAAPDPGVRTPKTGLEQRVEVLERIATDRSADLADEIEALRDDTKTQAPQGKILERS